MATADYGDNPNDPANSYPGGSSNYAPNWWEGPPPQGYTGTWPPPLPPGATYGTAFGSVVAAPGSTLPAPYGLPQAPAATNTPTTDTGGSGGSGGGGGTAPAGGDASLVQPPGMTFTPGQLPQTPTYTAPGFTPPTYTKPPAFSFESFHQPTYEEAGADPGYQFAVGQGRQALEQGAASRGVLNTGGTLKDLINYGQSAGAQQYQNVYNRDLSTYGRNYDTAAQTYATNAQSQYLQPYSFAYQSAMDQFAPKMSEFSANVGAGNLGYSTAAAANQNNAQFGANFDYNKWLAQRTQAPWQAAFA